MRTGRYSPLRYPGGKGKLAALIKAILTENGLLDGIYVEPYAGGAGVACELLAKNYVRSIQINDVSPAIFAFWKAALWQADRFTDDIDAARLSIDEWDLQKATFERERRASHPDLYKLGFSTFYLNRTNRSGILNGGMIGGRAQKSEWGLDARFNRSDLIERIKLLSSLRNRIKVTNIDALKLIRSFQRNCPPKTFIYLDPPYYDKGRQLYLDYYHAKDHSDIANQVQSDKQTFNWIVSYDNVVPIKDLYKKSSMVEYDINYSARSASTGSEVIVFERNLKLPDLVKYIQVTNGPNYSVTAVA